MSAYCTFSVTDSRHNGSWVLGTDLFIVLSKEGNEQVVRQVFIYHRVRTPARVQLRLL